MKKVIQKFKSFGEADQAEKNAYRSFTPEQRVDIVEILRERYYQIKHANQQGFRRILRIVKPV